MVAIRNDGSFFLFPSYFFFSTKSPMHDLLFFS